MEPDLLLAELQGSLRLLPRELELPAMRGDPRARDVVLISLDPVLDADVAGARGVLRRELPAPVPQLDPRELPEHLCAEELVALLPLSILAFEDRASLRRCRRSRTASRRRGCSPSAAGARRRRQPQARGRAPRTRASSASPTMPPSMWSCASASNRRTSSSRRSASSSAARVPSSAAANPFLNRSAQARRMWMRAWSAGSDDASRRASSRTGTARSSCSNSARRRRASARSGPASVSASRSVAIVRARVHSPAARCARAAASARRRRSSTRSGGVSRSACSASSAVDRRGAAIVRQRGSVVEQTCDLRVGRVRREREVAGARGQGRRRSRRCGRERPAALRPGRRTGPTTAAGG